MQRLDEALMIAEFVLSCMPSVPADKLGIGAAWGRIRHLWHTSCRSRARRGRTIMRHCSEPSHNVPKTQLCFNFYNNSNFSSIGIEVKLFRDPTD